MTGFKGALYREYKLLTGNRTNLLLGASAVLIYILVFGTSMSRLVPSVQYSGRSVRYTDFALPPLLVFSMVSAAITGAMSLFQERLARMDVELWSYPLRKASYVAAKVTATTLMVLMQTALALGLALLVFDVSWPVGNVPYVFVSCLIAAVSITGAYMLLSTFMSNFQRFTVMANILGPLMLFASASFYPAQSMPLLLRWISWINPMTYAIRAVRDAALLGGRSSLPINVALGFVALGCWLVVARGLVRRARDL